MQYLDDCRRHQGTFISEAVQPKMVEISNSERLILNFHAFWGALFAIYSHLNIALEIYGLKYCYIALSHYLFIIT